MLGYRFNFKEYAKNLEKAAIYWKYTEVLLDADGHVLN